MMTSSGLVTRSSGGGTPGIFCDQTIEVSEDKSGLKLAEREGDRDNEAVDIDDCSYTLVPCEHLREGNDLGEPWRSFPYRETIG